jgi:hypothetical protein
MNEEKQTKRKVAASLILKEGKTTLKTFKLFQDDQIITIGRHGNNTIRLRDDKNIISRSHAAIIRVAENNTEQHQETKKGKNPPQFFIRDLCSLYGTRVNSQYIRKKLLKEGDLVRIGDYIIDFTQIDLHKRPRGRTIDQDDEFGSSEPDAVTKLSPKATCKDVNFTDVQKEVFLSFAEMGMGVDPSESPKEFGEIMLRALPAQRVLVGLYDGEIIHIKYHKG